MKLLMLIDFSEDFDKLKHSVLMSKTLELDITENLFMLITDYLTGRKQRVKINDKLSPSLVVSSGIPKGSLLGPLQFLIYTIDLPDTVFFSAALPLADYLKLIHRADYITLTRLQEDLSDQHAWSVQNCLLLNLKKCPSLIHT